MHNVSALIASQEIHMQYRTHYNKNVYFKEACCIHNKVVASMSATYSGRLWWWKTWANGQSNELAKKTLANNCVSR